MNNENELTQFEQYLAVVDQELERLHELLEIVNRDTKNKTKQIGWLLKRIEKFQNVLLDE